MISSLRGKLVQINNDSIVIDINGVGFLINVSQNTLNKMYEINTNVSIYTHLVVREDDLVLYGFASQEEKKMFLNLITVSGVGPKAAISILSGLPLKSLAFAIVAQDVKTLSKIKGVGKKTAERLIVDLKEKVVKENATLISAMGDLDNEENVLANEALEAMCSLGIARAEALIAINSVKDDFDGSLESLLYNALKSMSRN